LGIIVSKPPSPLVTDVFPEIDVLYTNQVEKTSSGQVTSYHVKNVKLVDLCLDAEYQQGISRVLEQVAPMPMTGFFSAFQWLCGTGRVLVRKNTNVASPPGPGGGENSLLDAFLCVDAPTSIGPGPWESFLINSGLAVVAFEPMGHAGFLAESYHHAQLSLLDPDSHLLWNVFLTCDMVGAKVAVSEIDTCTQCDLRTNAGFVVLGTCLSSCAFLLLWWKYVF